MLSDRFAAFKLLFDAIHLHNEVMPVRMTSTPDGWLCMLKPDGRTTTFRVPTILVEHVAGLIADAEHDPSKFGNHLLVPTKPDFETPPNPKPRRGIRI